MTIKMMTYKSRWQKEGPFFNIRRIFVLVEIIEFQFKE